jgi:hypothetical protein
MDLVKPPPPAPRETLQNVRISFLQRFAIFGQGKRLHCLKKWSISLPFKFHDAAEPSSVLSAGLTQGSARDSHWRCSPASVLTAPWVASGTGHAMWDQRKGTRRRRLGGGGCSNVKEEKVGKDEIGTEQVTTRMRCWLWYCYCYHYHTTITP